MAEYKLLHRKSSLPAAAKRYANLGAFPGGSVVKNPSVNAGDVGLIPESGNPLEKEIATLSRILAWEFPWTEEPGGLQKSTGLQRVRPDLAMK